MARLILRLCYSVLSANVDFLAAHTIARDDWTTIWNFADTVVFIVGVLESFELQFQMQLCKCFIEMHKIKTLSEVQKTYLG